MLISRICEKVERTELHVSFDSYTYTEYIFSRTASVVKSKASRFDWCVTMDNKTNVANKDKLIKLKERFLSTIKEKKRLKLYGKLYKFKYWEGPLPDLRSIFKREEIEWLLQKSVDSIVKGAPHSLIDFAIKCKYKDVPEFDEDDRSIICRCDTALLRAARCKRFDVVHKLFEIYDSPDVNYVDEKSGNTHFNLACFLNKNELVKRFLEHGLYPEASVKFDPPLLLAIQHGNREIFRLLVQNCADPNQAMNRQRETALHLICQRPGDLRLMAKSFLKINAQMNRRVLIDAQDGDGTTPLMDAIAMQNWSQAVFLLSQGADARLSDVNGSKPLHYVGTLDEALHKTKIQSLLARIPNPQLATYVEQWTIGNELFKKLIESLLRRGAIPNAVDYRGWTVVHVICQREDDDDYDDFLSSSQTLSSLCEAVREAREYLQIDVPDRSGHTPLHYAVMHGSVALVEFLLTRGADPNAVTRLGQNCLHLICRRDADDRFMETFLKICDDRGLRVQLDAEDDSGETPLQWAVEKSWPNVVGVLVARGADVSRVVFPTRDELDERFRMLDRRADVRRLAYNFMKVVLYLENNGYDDISPENVRSIIRTFAKYRLTLSRTADGKIRIARPRRRRPENSRL